MTQEKKTAELAVMMAVVAVAAWSGCEGEGKDEGKGEGEGECEGECEG